jgi:hypothetical protein
MQDVLVAVSKHGLSVAELTGLRELEGKEYDNRNQFFDDIDAVLCAPSVTVRIILGYADDWAKFLSEEPFDNGAYIYFTIKAESLRDEEN